MHAPKQTPFKKELMAAGGGDGGAGIINIPRPRRRFTSRELALIVILSALGGVMSVPIGHVGNFLKSIPGIPFGMPQALSGLHVFWIVLAAILVRKIGASVMTGALKGLIEMCLLSYHGIFVLLISAVEGIVAEIVLAAAGRINTPSICIAGGMSSMSNVAVLQLLLLPRLPAAVLAFMYSTSFLSGLVFAGYLSKRVLNIAETLRS